MPAVTDATSVTPSDRRARLQFLLCLLSVLAILFHKSFDPDQVLFSNDGPLGAVRAQAGHMWSNLLAVWQDINWLGTQNPSVPFDVSGLLLALCCDSSPDFGSALFAKIYEPTGVFLLGLSAWFLFRQLRFRTWVCALGGLATALNTMAFSAACWGLAEWPLAWAMNLLAVAALVSPSIRNRTLRAILAGLAVGLGVMEGFDVGAIFSMFTAAFAFLCVIATEGATARRLTRGFAVVAIMTVAALLIAAETVSGLIGTQVKGVVGMAQDEATKHQRWDEDTLWSLPKAETLRFVIPGLFGYRMPELYGEQVQSVNGANYWGAVGQTPGAIQSRHSGMGFYAGVVVVIFAVFGVAQSFRKKGNAFSPSERKQLWCWLALLIVALLLGWGRHAPFYRLVYALPYFSTIRNPFKFLFPFSLALVVLFGYGLEGLCRLYLDKAAVRTKGWQDQLKAWWKTAPAFDRKWTTGCIVGFTASLLGWLIYAASKNELIRFLQQAGFPDPRLAESIAQFSIAEAGIFILFLGLSIALLTLILGGAFAGPRARWAAIALGVLVVIDLGRADTPWIVYWNYKQKYASNPIIDALRVEPYQHRVAARMAPMSPQFLLDYHDDEASVFVQVYYGEWLQHHFQYYRVQSLDIIQMPRVTELDHAFIAAFAPTNSNQLHLCGRLWQLTNTRYLLGMTGFLNQLNEHVDPSQHRFKIQTTFNLIPKPGLMEVTKAQDLTAAPATNGKFALFDFTGALPRAMLFGSWRVNTNDAVTLEELRNPNFDPAQSVFVANELPPARHSTNSPTAGTVQFARYEPKFIQLRADAAAPAVLLLNDRFHPHWKAWVDGKPAPVLRCNYIMRGVYLTPGKHEVEFRFQPPLTAFYISLTGLAAGVILCGYLVVMKYSAKTSEAPAPSDGRQSKIANRKSR